LIFGNRLVLLGVYIIMVTKQDIEAIQNKIIRQIVLLLKDVGVPEKDKHNRFASKICEQIIAQITSEKAVENLSRDQDIKDAITNLSKFIQQVKNDAVVLDLLAQRAGLVEQRKQEQEVKRLAEADQQLKDNPPVKKKKEKKPETSLHDAGTSSSGLLPIEKKPKLLKKKTTVPPKVVRSSKPQKVVGSSKPQKVVSSKPKKSQEEIAASIREKIQQEYQKRAELKKIKNIIKMHVEIKLGVVEDKNIDQYMTGASESIYLHGQLIKWIESKGSDFISQARTKIDTIFSQGGIQGGGVARRGTPEHPGTNDGIINHCIGAVRSYRESNPHLNFRNKKGKDKTIGHDDAESDVSVDAPSESESINALLGLNSQVKDKIESIKQQLLSVRSEPSGSKTFFDEESIKEIVLMLDRIATALNPNTNGDYELDTVGLDYILGKLTGISTDTSSGSIDLQVVHDGLDEITDNLNKLDVVLMMNSVVDELNEHLLGDEEIDLDDVIDLVEVKFNDEDDENLEAAFLNIFAKVEEYKGNGKELPETLQSKWLALKAQFEEQIEDKKNEPFKQISKQIEDIKQQLSHASPETSSDKQQTEEIIVMLDRIAAALNPTTNGDYELDTVGLDYILGKLTDISTDLSSGSIDLQVAHDRLDEINHDLDKRDVILAINNAVEIFNQQLDDPEDLDERLPAYNVNFNNISDYDLETILVDIFNKVEKRKDVLSPLSLPPNVTLAFSNLSEKFSEYKNYKTREEIEDREKRLFKQIVTEKIISEILDMKKESKLQLIVEAAKEKVGEIVNPFIQGFGKDGQTVKEKQDQIASLAEKVFTLACIGFHGEIGFKLVDFYVKSVHDTINEIQIVGGKIVPDAQRQQAKALEEKYCSMLFDALHEKFKQSKMLNDSQMDRSWFNSTDKVGGSRRKLQDLFDGVALYLGPPQQSDQVANCFAQAANRLGGVSELLKLFNGDNEPAPDRTLADREKKRPYIYKEDLEELWKPRLIDTDVTEFNIIKVLREYRLGVLKEIHNEEFNMLSGRMEEQNPSEETKLDILALTELDKKLLLEIARKQKIEDDKEKAQLQFKLQAKQLFKDEASKRRSIEGEEELGYEELEKIQDKLILMQVEHERVRQELDEKEHNARTNVTEEEELLRHDIQRELDKIKGEQLNEQQKVDKSVNEVVSIVQQANSIRDNKSTDLKKVVHMLNLLSNDLPHRISNLFYK